MQEFAGKAPRFCVCCPRSCSLSLPSWLNGVVKEDTFVSSNLSPLSSSSLALPLSYYFMIIRVVYRAVDSSVQSSFLLPSYQSK